MVKDEDKERETQERAASVFQCTQTIGQIHVLSRIVHAIEKIVRALMRPHICRETFHAGYNWFIQHVRLISDSAKRACRDGRAIIPEKVALELGDRNDVYKTEVRCSTRKGNTMNVEYVLSSTFLEDEADQNMPSYAQPIINDRYSLREAKSAPLISRLSGTLRSTKSNVSRLSEAGQPLATNTHNSCTDSAIFSRSFRSRTRARRSREYYKS